MKNVFFLAMIGIAFYGVLIYLLVLIIKALRKYLKSGDVRKEKVGIKKSLGENLKEHRVRCKMTVADACTGSNPRAIDPATMEKLFTCIYYGTEVDF